MIACAVSRRKPMKSSLVPITNLVHPVYFCYNPSHFRDPCGRVNVLRRFKLFEDRRIRLWSPVHQIYAHKVDVNARHKSERKDDLAGRVRIPSGIAFQHLRDLVDG